MPKQLLSKTNTKILKGEKYGWKTFGLHLAPSDISGKDVCPHSSKGCEASCLNTAGFGIYNNVQKARIEKTKYFFEDRQGFLTQLHREISNKVKNIQDGFKICFRLNLTSDVRWESIKYMGKSLINHFPTVQFYDYTKDHSRMLDYIMGDLPKNYHLTFSRSEENDTKVNTILGCGGNVAVVFDKRLPKTYKGKKVIDATENDLRFLDPKNTIAGLVALGKAKKDKSGFVVKTRKLKTVN